MALLIAFSLASLPASAQGTDGLDVSSTTTYTPDPTTQEVRVSSSYTLTNVQADLVVGDAVRSYFFTKWIIAIPINATEFSATAAGLPLAAETSPDPNGTTVVFSTITLPANLNYQEVVTVDVTYAVPGGEPRSDGSIARVNDSFFSFSIWASGDPGMVDVRVIVPAGFTMEVQGDIDDLELVARDGQTYYEALDIAQPTKFFGQVFGRNDAGLISESAELPGATATIRAWPDDPEWIDFVIDAIERDVPVIQELTGLAWPAGDIEVIETVTPYLYGYGGWFNASSGLIEVGDTLERDLILHELAHAWFNDDLIEGRWITEGLAEEFASRAIAVSDGTAQEPTAPDLTSPLRVQLAAWESPWGLDLADAFEYEQYHYNASWWVVRQITNEIGLEAFSNVLVALHGDEIAYAGEGPLEDTQLSTRWVHLFDLLDHRTDASMLDELFGTYVLTEEDQPKLVARRNTLLMYDQFTSASADWGPPPAVRNPLSAWDFDSAENAMLIAERVLDVRNTSDELATELDVSVEHQAEQLYEDAESLEDLTAALAIESSLHAKLVELQHARGELDTYAETLGLRVDYTQLAIADARLDVEAQRAALGQLEDARTQVDSRAASLSLNSPAWPETTGAISIAAAASLAEARLATLDAIEAAAERVEQPRSFAARIGLWRRSPEESMNAARTAFEADELADALEATRDADTLIVQAASMGKTRILWTVITAAVLITLVITASFVIRDRHTQPVKNPPEG